MLQQQQQQQQHPFFAKKPSATATSTANKSTIQQSQPPQPWTEKYRPRTIADVQAQDAVVSVLQHSLLSANLPHMLFYGPPGTGKTSTILALARQLYGVDFVKSRVLELNASDERGIAVVRQKVKDFARVQVTAKTSLDAAVVCPPYKLIILDEADSMTVDAQSALRRTMETYSTVTRFCLICNYVSRIIEPLASRCAKFRFKPLTNTQALERLVTVCERENVQCDEGVVECVVAVSGGDLRKAITYLQSAVRGTVKGSKLTVQSINAIAGVVPDTVIQQVIQACKTLNIHQVIETMRNSVVMEGYSGTQVLAQLHDTLVQDENIGTIDKAKLMLRVAQTEKRLHDGGDEELQLLSLCTFIHSTLNVSAA